jgi:hypothetical protein
VISFVYQQVEEGKVDLTVETRIWNFQWDQDGLEEKGWNCKSKWIWNGHCNLLYPVQYRESYSQKKEFLETRISNFQWCQESCEKEICFWTGYCNLLLTGC